MENIEKYQVEQQELAPLMAKVALRDQQAFKTLFDKTSPKVYGVVLYMLKNTAQAQDLLQEVYLRIWSQASEYQPLRGPVMPWILAIARYRVLDFLRAEKRRTDAMDRHEEKVKLDELDVENDMPESLKHCLDTLASVQRQSIFEAFFNGWTHEELAKKISVPIGTVKSRIRRGLARLKDCLEPASI